MTLRHEPDVATADWWARRDEPWAELCSIGPSGFASYARVLHPLDDDLDEGLENDLEQVEGDLDDATWALLAPALARHTDSPEHCLHALWEGVTGGGSLMTRMRGPAWWWLLGLRLGMRRRRMSLTYPARAGREVPGPLAEGIVGGPMVEIPARRYLLLRGPVGEAARWPLSEDCWSAMPPSRQRINSPHLVRPEDRAWFVATEVDSSWTGVGGSAELIAELLATPGLDLVRWLPGERLPVYR